MTFASETSRHPHRLLFVTSNLGGGGAERALLHIINHIDRDRFIPYLAIFQKTGVFLEELKPDVMVFEIQPQEGSFIKRNLVRARALRHLCHQIQPDLVMSIKWQVNLVTLLSIKTMGIKIAPIVINEQDKPSASTDAKRRRIWPFVKWIYLWSDHIITASQGVAEEVTANIRIPDRKISVINNPVDLSAVYQQSKLPEKLKKVNTPAIFAAGRLVEQKNFQLLLRAFAILLNHQAYAELYILGEGPQKEVLENLAEKLSISPQVHFMGFQANPFVYLVQADIFVLSSLHEGFGNVIVEAMSLGIPVISTNCPHGPSEILDDGRFGVLVPSNDEHALAQALLDLLDNTSQRKIFSELGKERAKKYSVEEIIPMYERIFQVLIEKRS